MNCVYAAKNDIKADVAKIKISKEREDQVLGTIDQQKLKDSEYYKTYDFKDGKAYVKKQGDAQEIKEKQGFKAKIITGDNGQNIYAVVKVPTNDPDRKIYRKLGNGAINDSYKQKNFKDSIDGVAKVLLIMKHSETHTK